MSMTREEAITNLEKLAALFHTESEQSKMVDYSKIIETLEFAAAALRSITREQVEKVRGEWIDCDGGKVPVDKYGQPFGWAMCSACGEYLTASDEYPCTGHFCPNCGAPMTDEAVDMVMERLEAVYERNDD